MLAKRALVVDDSRSARAFLAKLLEEQQIEVAAVETAEQAIEFLNQHRPDVIFMDHLMPGMDGFQAVQAIKANPRTASIPILMYTSQEGELYLGQARALGAVGVVQKNMAPPDVRALLQELELVPGPAPAPAPAAEAQSASSPSTALPESGIVLTPEEDAEVATTQLPTVDAGLRAQELVKEEMAALRQELTAALQAQGEQMTREMRSLVRGITPLQPAPAIVPEKPRQSPWAWLLALAASVAAAVLGTLWKQEQGQLDAVRTELMDSKSTVALLTARLAPAPADAVVVKVPFGEALLDATRVDALREFVTRVAAQGGAGTVEVRHHAGRFCLAGSATTGYTLADEALPADKCALVAGSTDPALGKTAESPAFTSALEELRNRHAAIRFDVTAGSAESAGQAYPEAGGAHPPTAGEWNAIAAANNRVEIRWHPAP